ncbi:6-phosphofructokinase [[Clostridium] colinum]|uniref:6-phosphofructokinase n=1 Tax=[Clostridium] colinum TaxID=36835 RepID=UPI002023F880|nr:6-phosphofructokinase [[Clostridium] colinum]
MGNIIVGQSGGPTAVINASLAGVFKGGKDNNIKVYGMINGIQGLLDEKYVELDKEIKTELEIELLKRTPSAYLGSCRFKLPNMEENNEIYEKIFSILEKLNIDKFFYIGGNDSMDTIKKLHTYSVATDKKIQFIGVPKTIDNDLAITDHTPGFGSACKYIATTIKEIIKDATVYDAKNITIIEIMGRNAGWLTASTAITKSEDCSGVDLIYLPEVVFDIEEFIAKIKSLQKTKKSLVIAISEGIKNKNGTNICEIEEENMFLDCFGHKSLSGTANTLAKILHKTLGCKTRAIELNTTQRCASHSVSEVDMNESFLAGMYAVNIALSGETGKVVIFERTSNTPYNINMKSHSVYDIANFEKKVPLEWIDGKNGSVSKELIDYIKPLIQGEIYPIMVDGLPRHLKLTNK